MSERYGEWLDIETAPTDGTRLLLAFSDGYIKVGEWDWDSFHGGDYVRWNLAGITHWMPLPPPPREG